MKQFIIKLESIAPDGVVKWEETLSTVINEKDYNRLFLHIGECIYRIDNKGFIIDRVIPHDSNI